MKGDGHCDDVNNNNGCEYDGGDCCGLYVQLGLCNFDNGGCKCLDPKCLYPNFKSEYSKSLK